MSDLLDDEETWDEGARRTVSPDPTTYLVGVPQGFDVLRNVLDAWRPDRSAGETAVAEER